MPDQRHWSSLYSNSMQYLHCTVIKLHGPSCDSMYIVQLLYCWVLAVTVFTLYSCWTTGSQLWAYIHCTIIDLQGPSCDSMYIIQLLYCRVPAVKEEYVYYTVILLQGPSCEGGVCILYSYCTAGSQLWGRCMYRILSQQRKMHRGIQSIQIQTKSPSFTDQQINFIPLRYPGCSNPPRITLIDESSIDPQI